MLDKEEKERYSRQILLTEIGEKGQERLKQAKVLVVGAGGLGCPVLTYLAGAGIGTLGIIDGDTVALHNLPRQVLYGQNDVGMPKVEVAKQRLEQNNPFCKIEAFATFLTKENAPALFPNYDIIVDCTDNFSTRYLIDETALVLGKMWVYASILEYKGQVSVFNGAKGQSYRALFAEENTDEKSASAYGVLGTLPSFVGSIQANEVLKLICQLGNTLEGKLLTYDTKTYRQFIFNL